jgi:hypothetical protein
MLSHTFIADVSILLLISCIITSGLLHISDIFVPLLYDSVSLSSLTHALLQFDYACLN